MPITDSAFAEVPELKGEIIQPENSRMRLSVADLENLFKQPGHLTITAIFLRS
jgi:hypothetical protein